MKCPMETQETSELLLAYCTRRLDADTAVWLERHIASCPACGETYRAQQAVWRALDEWDAAEISPDFDRRLYRAIDERVRTSWWERLSRGMQPLSIHRGLPLAAAACLLVMAGVIVNRQGDVRPAPAPETLRIEVRGGGPGGEDAGGHGTAAEFQPWTCGRRHSNRTRCSGGLMARFYMAAMLALAAAAALEAQRPAAPRAPARGKAARPRVPANTPIDRWNQMTPSERENALRKLPPERQKQIQERLEQYNRLPKEERDRLRERYEQFSHLTPVKQDLVRRQMKRFAEVPTERRLVLSRELRRLRRLPTKTAGRASTARSSAAAIRCRSSRCSRTFPKT